MRNTFILVLIFICSSPIFSQTNIQGIVVDDKNQPIEYANIILLTKDSTYILGNSASSDGKFSLSEISSGGHILKVSSLGYEDIYVTIPNTKDDIDLEPVVLKENTEQLSEVVVTGSRVINKVDRQINLPNAMIVKSSVQGFDLLSKMSIPDINVNTVNQSISAVDGGNIQLRINGIKAEIRELAAIRSEDVLRVETYNSPGSRYGNENVSIIIDVILKEIQTGGYVMTDLLNTMTKTFGKDLITGKTNHRNSEFGVMYHRYCRDYDERWDTKTSIFNDPDNSFMRIEDGIKTPFDLNSHNVNLSYNLTKKDKYVFNAVFKNEFLNENEELKSELNYSNGSQPSQMSTDNKTASQTSVLDLYFKYNLQKNRR